MAFPHDGNKIQKGTTLNPNGRPKKIENVLTDYFLAEHNLKLTKSQSQDIIRTILGKTKSELMELAKNDELPFWVSLIAKKATRDFEKGSIHILDVLFDRVYGKPKEEVDHVISHEQRIFKQIDLDASEDNSSTENI